MVAREVLLVLGVGLGFGISGAAAGTKLMTSYLFGVQALEPSVLALTALVLGLIGAHPNRAGIRLAPGSSSCAILRANRGGRLQKS